MVDGYLDDSLEVLHFQLEDGNLTLGNLALMLSLREADPQCAALLVNLKIENI